MFLDGLDGRIARMTHTTSDFGRELDSLADVISFGIAPAVLAFAWGVQFLDPSLDPFIREQVHRAGYFISFLFLLCGSARLARLASSGSISSRRFWRAFLARSLASASEKSLVEPSPMLLGTPSTMYRKSQLVVP